MWSRRLNEVSQMASAHPGGVDPGKELSSAWKSLSQTKAALRHIENRLEAVPGTGVLLNSVMDTRKTSSSTTRKISNREGRHAVDTFQGQVSKSRTRSCRSPEKSSRSPLRTTTLDSNVRRTSCVEFKEPLASYREPSPSPLTSSQHEAQSLMSVVPPSPHREMRLSQLVYRRDTRDQQTSEIDNTFPSAPDNTVVRYLNDRPALDALRQPVTRASEPSHGGSQLAEAPQSSSPGSTSQRLEILRRKQSDDKLEKLKERIRRQREHLEEAAEAQRMLECLEQPRCVANGTESMAAAPIAKVRKVAAAPPAPVYKGFNPSVPKVLTPIGKEWCEEDFQKLSTDVYQDLSLQLAEKAQSKPKPVDRGQDKKPCKPVRKVHKWAPQPTSDTKPAAPVISTSSWREGQKLVEMVLGPTPRLPCELRAEPVETTERKGPPRAKSDSRTESCRRPRASSTDSPKKRVAFGEQVKGVQLKKVSAGLEEETKRTVNDFLPPDMQGMLDDLQLDSGVHGQGNGGMGSRVAAGVKQRTRSAPASTSRTSRSTSPGKRRPETAEAPPRMRHYDANSVRQYITRQQEERRKRQQEERRAQRQEAERRNQRLQELYRKQREGVSRVPPTHEGPPQKRLQETYSKLLLEQAKLQQDLPWTQPVLESLQPKPLYQPSGESDKENKRLDRPQSASSSSDLSLSEPPAPLLTRAELDLGPAWLQADSLRPPAEAASSLVPPAGHLFTQLLGLDTGTSGLKRQNQNVPPADELTKSKTSRIEALKAKAASISTRIETEARKLAMAGINSGHASGPISTNAVFSPQVPQDKGLWIKPCSPPEREDTEPKDLTLKLQQLLSAGQSGCDGTLPGMGNLHTFGNLTERLNEVNKPRAASVTHLGLVSSHESEHEAGHLNSSVESISEGPLLSEGSLSDHDHDVSIEGSIPKPVECIGSPGFCMAERDALHPIARFQREAQKYHAFSTLPPATENRSPWEELAKGSPHSVINIFTKNLHSYSSAIEQKADQGSEATRPAVPAASPLDSRGYEDDFVSSHSAGGTSQSSRRLHSRLSCDNSVYSPHDELLNRRSPNDVQAMDLQSLHSSGSTPVSSPHSAGSLQKQAAAALEENSLERMLVEGQKPTLDGSGSQSQESRQGSPGNSHPCSPGHGTDSDATLRSISGLSALSLVSDGKKSPRSPSQSLSPASGSPGSPSPTRSSSQKALPDTTSSAGARHRKAPSSKPPHHPGPSSASLPSVQSVVDPSALTGHRGEGRAECKATDELQYTPGVLQHRMSAELSYLDAIEESVRQLADVERLRGVSLAQQESVSLAQILKAQQQRHEHDLFLLKLKAEKEELETRRQLEETRQRAARAHAELQENMARSRQESLGSLQEATTKMIGQQAEAVRYTSDAARHIREMTELAHSHIAQALNVPATPVTALFDQQRQQHHMRQIECHIATDSRKNECSSARSRTEESVSSLNSPSESTASRTHGLSSSSNEIAQVNLSKSDRRKNSTLSVKEVTGSSVKEEAHVAADSLVHSDSIPSLLDEKDNTSVATEYSLKFDESMTEDDIEERSFRSLLPSESHRRGVGMEKKRGTHEESEDEACQEKSSVLDGGKSQEGSVSFSNGQDSFSKFTMDMVRQYMKEEEVRAQHQNSLLRLREKALKEKTKAELAWLEHQKRHLRDKGEDDKMPPIRKRQRGLLLKLQQEQAEIKRLQEANKAARKERQLLLKQQEEIERMRHTTLKIKERLKSAGETQMETSTMEVTEDVATPVKSMTDLDTRSPSPISVSGSETSSIMQKLKKMRCHMDEKFLTKREQQLMRRRRHAEELLEWKQRLDAEEAEVRRMEKQALAAWDGEHQRDKHHRRESSSIAAAAVPSSPEAPQELAKDSHSADIIVSSLPTEPSVPEDLGSPSTDHPVSELPSPHKDTSQDEHSVYSQDFDSSSESKVSPLWKATDSVSRHPESSGVNKSSGSRSLYSSISLAAPIEPSSSEQRSTPPSEPTSDQSDIESRIRALKEELRTRKSIVCQLKKEQRKRHKERLKAQEASLLKQLESYNEFIQKTKAELDEDLDVIPTTKPQIKTPTSATEKPRIKPPPVQRPETSKHFKVVTELEKEKKVQLDSETELDDIPPSGRSKFTFMSEEGSSEDDHSTMTPTPVLRSPDHFNGLKNLISSELHSYSLSEQVQAQEKPTKPTADSGEEIDISSQKSVVEEELEYLKSDKSGDDSSHFLKLIQEQQPRIQQQDSLKDNLSARSSEGGLLQEKSICDDIEDVIEKEDLLSSSSHSDKLKSLHEEQEQKGKDQHLSEINSPIKEHHYTPESDILLPDNDSQVIKEEHPDAYVDDFESSAESSPHEGYHGSKPSSLAALDKEEKTYSRSHTYTSEEDIGEELGDISFAISGSSHSGVVLDMKSQAVLSDKTERENKEGVGSLRHSPSVSPPQSPVSQTVDPMFDFNIGDRVLVSNVQLGTLRFKGLASFAKGFWAGVELDESEGSNNGTYDGVVYFECEERHGIFAPPNKISRVPEKFEVYVDTSEDEDSFDEPSDSMTKKQHEAEEDRAKLTELQDRKQDESKSSGCLENKAPSDMNEATGGYPTKQTVFSEMKMPKSSEFELYDLKTNTTKLNGGLHPTPNGTSRSIILEFEDISHDDYDLITEARNETVGETEKASIPILDLLAREKDNLETQQIPSLSHQTPEAELFKNTDAERILDEKNISSFADNLLNNFVMDAIKQLQNIKKNKTEKITVSNQLAGESGTGDLQETTTDHVGPCTTQPYVIPSFIEDGQEVPSPELYIRPESPVLGASGQEELAKRLAELELSRELQEDLGDEQDWFDEDFGLSSRKEQQKRQQSLTSSGPVAFEGGERAKILAKPEHPQHAKPTEEPAMVVPHTALEVEQLVHSATQVIWNSCNLGQGLPNLVGVSIPLAPEDYFGCNAHDQDLESLSKRSYRQAVFDLTWEIIQEIFAEDPNAHQPQWVKPRHMNSSYFRRVKFPSDISEVQNFVTNEVLKLLGLKKDQNQKTDWQKMLKFGRKKRDRVDQILVQELHEEESQWVNYDEDELFVKMQLADGIFDALMKDTVDVFLQIQEKQVKRIFS